MFWRIFKKYQKLNCMKVVASIEARMGSSRLPGKVLKTFGEETALSLLLKRLKKSKYLDDIIVSTTTESRDDIICNWCLGNNIQFFRGDEKDVLDRVVKSHEKMKSDLVVEITGDCPFTDPKIIDLGIKTFIKKDVDIVTNCGNNLSWPIGMYVQVFPLNKLKWVNENISDPYVHEHVSIYFYENTKKYKIHEIFAPKNLSFPNIRMVLDYEEDYIFLNKLFDILKLEHGLFFSLEDIMKVLNKYPEFLDINKHCIERKI